MASLLEEINNLKKQRNGQYGDFSRVFEQQFQGKDMRNEKASAFLSYIEEKHAIKIVDVAKLISKLTNIEYRPRIFKEVAYINSENPHYTGKYICGLVSQNSYFANVPGNDKFGSLISSKDFGKLYRDSNIIILTDSRQIYFEIKDIETAFNNINFIHLFTRDSYNALITNEQFIDEIYLLLEKELQTKNEKLDEPVVF